VETHRRNTSKEAQEQAVNDLLTEIGFTQVAVREIPMLTEAPNPGEFCDETRLAGTRADVVVRLRDRRVMPIECKVSDSAVNSYKRLVHDTGGKPETWYRQLGAAQVIPAAVLSGVYSPANCEDVQNNKRVALFWQHRLKDLKDFIKRAICVSSAPFRSSLFSLLPPQPAPLPHASPFPSLPPLMYNRGWPLRHSPKIAGFA